nr:type 3 dihydrofolate reductase [Thalassotalea agarivorans]
MIVAHADNRIIGKDNDMPWHLPADLAYFKKTTLGKPVVMGRKTYESIGRPLPGRQNIVITRDPNYAVDGVTVVNSIDQALQQAGDVEEIMVIGGGAIYAHCLPSADKLYVTHIEATIEGDTQFPAYDTAQQWQLIEETPFTADEKNAYNLRFCVYQRS